MCIQHLKIIFEYLINHLIGIGKYSNVMCVCEWSMHIEWLETLLPLYSRRVCAEDLNMEYFFIFDSRLLRMESLVAKQAPTWSKGTPSRNTFITFSCFCFKILIRRLLCLKTISPSSVCVFKLVTLPLYNLWYVLTECLRGPQMKGLNLWFFILNSIESQRLESL